MPRPHPADRRTLVTAAPCWPPRPWPPAPAAPRQPLFSARPDRVPQFARRFEAKLNRQLLDLPVSAVPGATKGALARPVASLAVRNLLRSETLELPSGQDVARKVGEVPLTHE